ncbi:hypothetical protein V494_04641 [Pseudogymnoascus sp. VKM F-4513 (FW-928)]|nr:hypothetical protein V494_04641 [Pseudogymnoascus sp. VKM F-4513 (FW-928)]
MSFAVVKNALGSVASYSVAVALTFAFAAYIAHSYKQYSKLSAFRGPPTSGWSNFWLVRAVMRQNTHIDFADVNQKYGPVARIAPNKLVTSSPELLFRMSAARSLYTRSDWYAGLRLPPGQDNIFSTMDEKKHTRRRAQMADGYTGKTNAFLESTIDSHVLNLVRLVRSKYLSSSAEFIPMDMAKKAAFLTMDVITDIAFRQSFGNLVDDHDTHRYIQSTEEMLPVMITLTSIPALSAFFQFPWVAKLFSPNDKDATGVGKLIGIARKLVHERFTNKSAVDNDMMASFIAHGLSETDLVAESLLQILAGADTTATAIRATLLHLMTHPLAYNALQSEIDKYVQEGLISSPVVKDTEASKMKYLQAVIKEGLRIWPPVTGLLSKQSPAGGDEFELDGQKYFIPEDTSVGYCAWGVHRNKEIFGPDADMFRPERWLTEDTSKLAVMNRTAELIWGYGKYQCLGRPVALMELNKVFVELLRNFDFELVDSTSPWKSANVGLWIQSELWVRVTEREDRQIRESI